MIKTKRISVSTTNARARSPFTIMDLDLYYPILESKKMGKRPLGVKEDMEESSLMVAVLERAISDLTLTCDDIREDARSWVLSNSMYASEGFTFCIICEHLDWCPDLIRQKLRKKGVLK